MTFDFNTALLIHIGALFYIVAFLIRDELKLRLLVLAGSGFYILYYYLFPDLPLWDAILTTAILVTANLIVLFRIILERSTFALSDDAKRLYKAFEGFTPGQFRQILKIAHWKNADQSVLLVTEGEPLSRIYYVFHGNVQATKGAHSFTLGPGNFIGEISFVLKGQPTATVTAPPQTRYVEWDSAGIRQIMVKSPTFDNAMLALLSRDLAEKLAKSVPPDKIVA